MFLKLRKQLGLEIKKFHLEKILNNNSISGELKNNFMA